MLEHTAEDLSLEMADIETHIKVFYFYSSDDVVEFSYALSGIFPL